MSEEGRKIFNSLSETEQKTLRDKIKGIIKNLVDWVNELLGTYESKSYEAAALRDFKEELSEISKAYDKMLMSAIEANKALETEGIRAEEIANEATQDEAVQLSEKEIIGKSGKNYGMGVYLDSSLLTNLTETERKEMVMLFVKDELAGRHFVAYDNNSNAVDVRLATKAEKIKNQKGDKKKVLQELYRKNNKFTVKQEAVVLVDELIASAKFDTSKGAKYPHDWLDNYGQNDWDYWKVFIQEKNKTVWEATLNIATSANGEKILYDIDPIEMVEEGVKSPSTTTNISILNSPEKNNKQIVKNEDIQFSERLSENDLEEYIHAGSRTNIKKQEALTEGKKIILTTEDEIISFIHDSIEGEDGLNTVGYGRVNKRLSNDVDMYSNGKININGSFLELVPYDISHAYREHLRAKEDGDIDLSISDFENIPYYIDHYDDLVYAIRFKSGNTRICLSKKLPNGRILIIETVSKSRGSIAFKNMIGVSEKKYSEYIKEYKKRNSTNTRGSESSNISLRDDTVPTDSIYNSPEKNNKQIVKNEDVQFSERDDARITADMSDEERYEILKDKKIVDVPSVSDIPKKVLDNIEKDLTTGNISSWGDVNKFFGKEKRTLIQKIASEFGVFKDYKNTDISVDFEFSKNNFRESYGKQKKNYDSYAKMFSVFDDVVKNAIGIEVHNRNNKGYKKDVTLSNVYVMVSAFLDGDLIYPVKLEVKEFKDKQNSLYVAISLEAIKMTEVSKQGTTENSVAQNSRSVTISIHDILKNVNTNDINFLKYVPNGFLNNEQIKAKEDTLRNELNYFSPQFSERDNGTSAYDLIGNVYTEKEYKDFGWARANNLLNAGQNADYRSKFADAKVGKAKFNKSKKGEYIIPVSDIYDPDFEGVNNVLVFAKGTIDKPIITSIIEIYEFNETELDKVRRKIYELERRGIQPKTEELFRRYNASDFRMQHQGNIFQIGRHSDGNGLRGRSGEEAYGAEEKNEIKYSERDEGISAYDLIGEKKALEKRYKKLESDFENLKERLKLEKTLTKGKIIQKSQLEAVARYLIKYGDSNYSSVELAKLLNNLYVDIQDGATDGTMTFDEMYAKCYEVAEEKQTPHGDYPTGCIFLPCLMLLTQLRSHFLLFRFRKQVS